MKLKLSELHVTDENPFAEDALGREQSANILTQLISTIDDPFVLAIDSCWGTGKTTFLRMWLKVLKREGYPCLYFNAWKNDFSDDPLVSLIGEIGTGLDDLVLEAGNKAKAKKYFDKTKKLGAALVKSSLPAVIKLSTGVDAAKIFEDLTNRFANDKIKKYEKDKTTIDDFKKHLCEFIEVLTGNDGGKKPLIIFIDELDRCRPTYALELLEKAKHFFDIQGIVFVLAIDKEQIGHSIRSVYGAGMDVDGYLRRFIDLDYHLPEPDTEKFCNALFQRFGFEEYFWQRTQHGSGDDMRILLEILPKLFTIFGFSLRVQEQCLSRLSIVFRTTKANVHLHPIFLSALIVLKAANPTLYSDYIKRSANAESVLKFFKQNIADRSYLNERYFMIMEAYFVNYEQYGLHSEDKGIKEYKLKLHNERPPQKEHERLKEIVSFFGYFNTKYHYDILSFLAKKIEMAESFS